MKKLLSVLLGSAACLSMLADERPQLKWIAKNPFEQKVFIENKGQYDHERMAAVLFGARQDGLQYYFSKQGILIKRFAVIKRTHAEIEAEIKRLGIKEKGGKEEEEKELKFKQVEMFYEMKFLGAGSGTEIFPQREISTKYTFGAPNNGTYIANAYERITYKNLYPGIDMEFYFPEDKQGFKYNFIVHPGADPAVIQIAFPDAKKVYLDNDKNFVGKSTFGEFVDHAPIASEMNTGKAADCSFQLKDKILSFDVRNFDPALGVIIDPWTTTPFLSGSNNAYDVDWDNYGNCYVYGGAGPFSCIKFDSFGNQLWNFATSYTWYYGDFAVDHKSGSVYIIEGFNSGSGANVTKLYGNGTVAANFFGNSLFQEMWRIAFSRCTNQAVIAGGGTTDPSYTGCYLDTNVTSLTPVNVIGSPTGLHDMWGCAIDDFGNCYMSTAQTQVGSAGYDNILYRMPLPGLAPLAWQVATGYAFVEVASVNYTPGPGNGYNGMCVSGTTLYTYDNYNLQKWATSNGSALGSLSINGASQSTMTSGGLTSDDCDNVFLGLNNSIYRINGGSMSIVSSFGTPGTVYDVNLGKNNNLYACGAGWVGNYNAGLGFCNSGVLNTAASVTNATCGNATGSATVTTSGGTAPYSYSWSNGSTGPVASNLPPGTYTVVISDASCNTQADQIILTISSAPSFTLSTSASNVTCGGGSNGSASVNINGGTPGYTTTWSNGATGTTATNLPAGTYTVTVTDGAGCTQQTTATVSQPTPVSATGSSGSATCSQSNGSASVSASGGTGSYSYSWAPFGGTGPTASGLPAGTYTCTITDGNGCSTTQVVSVGNIPGPSLSISSSSNVSCNGGSNGSATASPSGGTPGYNYNWVPFGGTSATASGLPAGTYTCNVTDASGCPAQAVVTISQPGALNASASSSPATCGSNNGSATVNASGGAGGYTYSWAPSGGTGTTASGLGAGSYTCTVTDANGCTKTAITNVNNTGGPSASITASSSVTCPGGNNGSATASASGGTAGYSYSWAPFGGSSATASNLPAGSYTVTVADANNCLTTTVVNISQPAPLVPSTSATSVSCNGGANGSTSISVSGGTAGYTYTWSPSGGNGTTASGLPAGTYTCNVTDANGCTTSATANVAQPAPLTASGTTSSVSCNGGADGTATANPAGGNPSYTYTWMPSGGNASTATGLSLGSYTCNITDATGCTTSAVVSIFEPAAISVTPSSTPALCGQTNGAASVSASGGTGSYTYNWLPTGGNASTASGLGAGSYTCTVADGNNCTQTSVVNITNTGGPAATASATGSVSCTGGSNGSATVSATGGTGSYTYTWSPQGGNNSTATNLPAGSYTVTVADANNCLGSAVVSITEPAVSLSSIAASSSVTCNATQTGSATVTVSGGTSAYTYTWSPSGGNNSTATGLGAGTYTCDITDANGCTTNTTVTIAEPAAISIGVTASTTITCNGGTNGAATVNASGGVPAYTYTWSPSGGNGTTASGLSAGTYTCDMTDANGCTGSTTVTIAQPSPIAVTITKNSVSCNGSANGSASANISGGTSAYTYTWMPSGGNSATATGLSGGSYTCNITDANGCTGTASTSITEPPLLTMSITSTSVTCNGGTNGSAVATTSGGTGTVTYTWMPSGGGNATASNLPAGTYACFGVDANGCMTTSSVTVTQPAPITVATSASPVGCSGGSNGSASANVSGGTSPYTVSWNTTPVQTGTVATGLSAGVYSATVTDGNNCTAGQSVIITEPLPVDSLDITGTLCVNESEVVLSAPSGGIIPDNISGPYQWYNGTTVITGANGNTYTGSQVNATSYSVTWYMHGCRHITTNVIETIYQDISTLPQTNIFTPNNDRVNDEFIPISLSNGAITVTYQQIADVVEDYELYIYDRWGTLVFHTNQVLDTWTGIEVNGKEASAGTYFWMAKYKTKCNTGNPQQELKGYVQLIR